MIGEDFNADGFGAGLDLDTSQPDAGPAAPPPVAPAPVPATSPLAGLSPNYRDIVGQIESSGGKQIGNGGGKYQFLPSTAKQYGGTDDAALDRLTTDNVKTLSKAGVPVNDVTAYVAHQQGAGGARKLLTAPGNAIAADVIGTKNAQGNRPFFYAKDGTPLTVAQSLEVYNAKVKGAGSKAPAMVATAAPGAPAEVNSVEAPSAPAGANNVEAPKTMKERLRAWIQTYDTPAQQPAGRAAALESEDELPAVVTVPLGQAKSGVVRSGGKMLFQRYGRTFDAHGNLVG